MNSNRSQHRALFVALALTCLFVLSGAVTEQVLETVKSAFGVHSDVPGETTSYKVYPSDEHDGEFLTTSQGSPVRNNENSLTVGARGPVLLEDFHLTEKLAQFDRERIPERVVHARGATAKGYFEVTHDVTDLTFADFLNKVGKKTPVLVRFSTVTHERGSPETLRDPRGFAVKFYTEEGNWDLVGNNIPVFFIRDGIKFPDLIHAFKPNPKTNIQEWWRILDFLSHLPESMHMLTWLLDDVGIPASYRNMPGFGVNTFKLINKEGKERLVKFHWVPEQEEKSLDDPEAAELGGMQHSAHTKDLYDNIKAGNYPAWKFMIQTMEDDQVDELDFDPLDDTKIWPEEKFPLKPVGRMVLNQNIDNFFTENEQAAFGPGIAVPGIGFSDDKMLQTRIFSYSDTARYRVGTNYQMLPVNAPRNKFHNSQFDGQMNFMHRTSEVNYHPSTFDDLKAAPEFPVDSEAITGKKVKETIPKTNDFQQAGDRWRGFDTDRQQRFVRRVVEKLTSERVTDELRRTWVGLWMKVDTDLGGAIQNKLKEMKAL